MRNEINAVDLAFVVDTTGSMGGLIAAAQRQMVQILQELSQAADINLWLGVVEYRDHPPQDTMVYRVHAFTDDLERAQETINGLTADGGGDTPEAVLDGITAACHELAWWQHSRRVMVLVGDAPPHGIGANGGVSMQGNPWVRSSDDGFARGCPCGETIESVTRLAEEKRITIHALGLTTEVNESFGEISALTGGQFFSAEQGEQAIAHIATILKMEFANLELDRRVLDVQRTDQALTLDEMAARLETSRSNISNSLVRLLSRDLIEMPAML